MSVTRIYLRPNSAFTTAISEWAASLGIPAEEYDIRMEEHLADGLLLVNENQDVDRELSELHGQFFKKHIPTLKVDINGTLQVAVSGFEMWIRSNKCRHILIVGSEKLVKNDNLQRFLDRIGGKPVA